jgi:hypothetical protein
MLFCLAAATLFLNRPNMRKPIVSRKAGSHTGVAGLPCGEDIFAGEISFDDHRYAYP